MVIRENLKLLQILCNICRRPLAAKQKGGGKENIYVKNKNKQFYI